MNLTKHLFVLIFILMMGNSIFSQNEFNNWVFGVNAGLSFDGTVNPPTNFATVINTPEGSSSISDASGNLLFYTDGESIWNVLLGTTMSNVLTGHSSATQSSLIIPNPSNSDEYFIFCLDHLGGSDGLAYGIFNPYTDYLSPLTSLQSNLTEKLSAVKKPNGTGYWIVVHGWEESNFYVYELDCDGNVNPNPNGFVQNVGAPHFGYLNNHLGYLRFNSNGTKMAVAVHLGNYTGTSPLPPPEERYGFVQVFDFDPNLGIISSLNIINIGLNASLDGDDGATLEAPYGLEFSKNSQFLYVSCGFTTGDVCQVDLQNPTSVTKITASSTLSVRALLMGPNGKIYATYQSGGTSALGVINTPEVAISSGAINLNTSNHPLTGTGTSSSGLPNFVTGLIPSHLDLYTGDAQLNDDFGEEPYVGDGLIYLSSDIWVRNQPDGIANQVHQNAEHSSTGDPSQLNYVYVRVKNRGCTSSSGDDVLHLYWSKAATASLWPSHWNGTLDLDPPNLAMAGEEITPALSIPIIPPGGEVILEFPWNPPNPENYNFNPQPWHFCLLSRIVSLNDPMSTTEGVNIADNVMNNNNIAWKNLTVVNNVAGLTVDDDCPPRLMNALGVTVGVTNPYNEAKTYDVIFEVPTEELDDPITDVGKIFIEMDNELYLKWEQGGKKGYGFTETLSLPIAEDEDAHNPNPHPITSGKKIFEVTDKRCAFKNITLAEKEYRTTAMMVTYPGNSDSRKTNFLYDIIQRKTSNANLIGGVRYAIKKPENTDSPLNAGKNQIIQRGCSTQLTASIQNPCYAYFWLNEEGEIVSRESNFIVSPSHTTTYTLKVISSHGIVSESAVTVTVLKQLCTQREIVNISPNPVNDIMTIKYNVENSGNASVRLVKSDNSLDRNYPLDILLGEIRIDVSDMPFGAYVVTLICDGIKEDNKNIIIH